MTAQRLLHLRNTIDRADQCYFYGSSFLTDDQYDALKVELKTLDPADPRLTRVGCPVPPSQLAKVKHTVFTGSLDKCDTVDDFKRWYTRGGDGAIVVCLKVDGNSLILYYEKGQLVRAVTRGGDDGVGEDVTSNAIRSAGIHATLALPITCAVRGESYLSVANWLLADPDQESNPRNIGSGLLRRQEGAGAELLEFMAFDLVPQEDVANDDTFAEHALKTEAEKLLKLKSLGFQPVAWWKYDTAAEAMAAYESIKKERPNLGFWIDGVVFKLDDLEMQRRLGYSHNRPRGQTVVKFEAESAETTLRDVIITIGHTGAIIPTAALDPVRIGGTTVSSALLNNFDMIADLDLAIGDRINVIKAKDIIPYVLGVSERVYTCPECGFKGTLTQQEEYHEVSKNRIL